MEKHSPDQEPLRIHHNPLLRYFLIVVGTISLILAIIGIFLPGLPTTPFLLLSAACYARSSRKFYTWLLNHRIFGPYIYHWRVEKRIPLRIKIYAISLIIVTVGISVLFLMPPILPAKIVVVVIAFSVIVYILRFPS